MPRSTPHARPHLRSAAFTLIELLVVISIIAVLIGLLLPSLGGARKSAKALQCATQLRGVALGVEAYATDHSDLYPPRRDGASNIAGWPTTLLPYYNTVALLWCPEDSIPQLEDSQLNATTTPDDLKRSYIINGFNDYFGSGNPAGLSLNRNHITQGASSLITFGERETASNHFYMDSLEGGSGNEFTELEESRHGAEPGSGNGFSNYAFADNHVQSLKFSESYTPFDKSMWNVIK